jgi:UDP-glucose 6-dehydrogenase
MGTSQKFADALKKTNIDDICDYHLFYHPEFLRAEKSEHDALHPIKQIFGYIDGKPKMDSSFYISNLEEIFSPRGSSRSPITMMESAEEAEFLKLVHNFSNAMRISFSNCCARLALPLSIKLNRQIDASRVLSIVSETAESFYNNKYGINPGYPYAGHCLPKDVQCFMNITDEQPYQQFIQSVHLINEKEKDHKLSKDS